MQNKDEEGKEMFLRLNYWRRVIVGCAFIGTPIILWSAYNSTNEDGGDSLFDRLLPILLVIAAIVALLVVISTALCAYYYHKTAAHLGLKFGLLKSPWEISREMERIAKEKKWI